MTEENKEEIPKPILLEDLGRMYPTENSKQKMRFGLYKCGFCGSDFKAYTYNVVKGKTKSCGCYQKKRASETNKTHGLIGARLYSIWTTMKNRVFNSNRKVYKDYGGRGISICDEWKNDFMSFYTWAMSNGYSDELSIDRIDNDENYTPENCKWTTQTIQNRNRRISKNNTSGYKGVSYYKKYNKYVAYIKVNNKKIFLGYYKTTEEGAIAYNNYIIENNLEGFILNEIPEDYQQCKLN